jgi:UDP-galactopyranose mutase
LRWDFVWQRPQHLLSRFARQHRVLVVEEPVTDSKATKAHLEFHKIKNAGNLTVVRLVQPCEKETWIGHGEPATQAGYSHLLRKYLKKEHYTNPVLWLYTPMGLEFVNEIKHNLLVYDVMDQLAAFKGAPPELLIKERRLLKRADLIFTGGTSLYRDKKTFNKNVYLFPSGVEIEHFAPAAQPGQFEKPADLVELGSPLLGYYGVIDERMDFNLLAYLAQARPAWQIALLGPIAKISKEDLPQAPNLHYLGIKSYDQLPAYLAHFEVALIPFALNEATCYLSPTKTLEYLAAHKPVVATPIHDVVELYGEFVKIGYSLQEFVAQVEMALKTRPGEVQQLKAQALLAKYSWDCIAERMDELIQLQAKANSKYDLAKVIAS